MSPILTSESFKYGTRVRVAELHVKKKKGKRELPFCKESRSRHAIGRGRTTDDDVDDDAHPRHPDGAAKNWRIFKSGVGEGGVQHFRVLISWDATRTSRVDRSSSVVSHVYVVDEEL